MINIQGCLSSFSVLDEILRQAGISPSKGKACHTLPFSFKSHSINTVLWWRCVTLSSLTDFVCHVYYARIRMRILSIALYVDCFICICMFIFIYGPTIYYVLYTASRFEACCMHITSYIIPRYLPLTMHILHIIIC